MQQTFFIIHHRRNELASPAIMLMAFQLAIIARLAKEKEKMSLDACRFSSLGNSVKKKLLHLSLHLLFQVVT